MTNAAPPPAYQDAEWRRAVAAAAIRTAECDPEDPIEKVEIALEHFRAGNFVLVMDAADREDEGDLILAAELCEGDYTSCF